MWKLPGFLGPWDRGTRAGLGARGHEFTLPLTCCVTVGKLLAISEAWSNVERRGSLWGPIRSPRILCLWNGPVSYSLSQPSLKGWEQPGPRLSKCSFPYASVHVLYWAGEGSDFKARNESYLLDSHEEEKKSGKTNYAWDVS